MKNSYVSDTMALVLWMEKRKQSPLVKSIFKNIESGTVKLYIPAIVLAEIGYLSERKRIETNLTDIKLVLKESGNIKILPLDSEIIYGAFEINDIPELHDRLISATARKLRLELITNDKIITDSKFVKTIW